MTVDECQSRWTRLRERYTREKKQRQEETTTGSGASKRKTFEFFNNMQFLDPFVKKRRTMTNVQHAKSSPLTKRCISLQKDSTSLSHKSSDAVTSCQSDASSISVLNASDYARKKGLSRQIKSKGKSQPDVVNAISKVTSLLENKYSSISLLIFIVPSFF
ncbi:uncharacterized protein [Linepithema humile]|uniref:uncharacterized protein isoform X1 n=1 Tax=Linepithema humile TaxID=83485 RepID=UPI00351F7771